MFFKVGAIFLILASDILPDASATARFKRDLSDDALNTVASNSANDDTLNDPVSSEDIAEAFKEAGIVPGITPTAPPELARVKYPTFEAQLGNVVSPVQVLKKPAVTWSSDPDAYYTLAMVGDEPRSLTGILTEKVQHWLVGNIPGGDVGSGQVLSIYIPSLPPSGPYRYTFLVYKQPGKLEFREIGIPNLTTINVLSFSISDFAKKYNLGDPVAGNYYVAKLPDVPVVTDILKPIVGGDNPL